MIENGPNVLPKVKESPMFIKFLLCFTTGFAPLLWISFIFVFLSYEPFGTPPSNQYNLDLAIALLVVIFLSGLFQFYQEVQTSIALSTFSNLVPPDCIVIRDKQDISISPSNLVVGDVVRLESGIRVPADIRIVSSADLKVDKSMLTGENEPVKLISDPVSKTTAMLQAVNMVFMGCNIVEGQGMGVVVATGDNNQLAKIANQVTEVKKAKTSLQIEIDRFVIIIGVFSLIAVIVVVVEWALYLNVQHNGFLTVSGMISNAISVLVAFVPEGLPLALQTGLTIIASRLCYTHFVLMKQLSIIETVGSMTFLASDKTGTLTQNKMTVRNIVFVSGTRTVSELVGIHPDLVQMIYVIGTLCNQSKLEIIDTTDNPEGSDGTDSNIKKKREAVGSNGIDKALLNWIESLSLIEDIRLSYRTALVIPFSSSTKIAMTIVLHDNSPRVLMKGAPEYILERCSYYYDDTTCEVKVLDKYVIDKLMNYIDDVADNGQRIIAIARSQELPTESFPTDFVYQTDPAPNFPTDEFIFICCIAVSDPPRVGVLEAVQDLRGAGITVAMVTGDAPSTAVSIAKQVGIIANDFGPDLVIAKGDEVSKITDNNQSDLDDIKLESKISIKVKELDKLKTFLDAEKRLNIDLIPDSDTPKESIASESKKISDHLFHFSFINNKSEPSKQDSTRTKELIRNHTKTSAVVVDGKDLCNITDLGWDYIFQHKEFVFARTTPDQKLLQSSRIEVIVLE